MKNAAPIVLLLPAFNEAATVAAVVGRVPEHVRAHPVVCLVVDDGSTDDTVVDAASAGATVITHTQNLGLGAAIRTGLAAALEYSPAAVAFCDADGEYQPAELERLVAPILGGQSDYVVGSRFAGAPRTMRPHRWLGNKLLTFTLARLTGWDISDGQSGYRALSPAAARAAEIVHDYNYAQVLTIDLLQKGFRYAEVPITYEFRRHGRSFVKLGTYLTHVLPAVTHMLYSNPPAEPQLSPAGPRRP